MRRALLLLALLAPTSASAAPPVPAERLGADAALWGARSCAGEAGWDSWTGECAAVLHVYVARWRAREAREPRLTYARVVRAYSSAVKRGPWQTRPWIFHLGGALERPHAWPQGLSWERHRDAWGRLLATAHAVLEGLAESPCPDAQHYGNRTTDGRPAGHVRAACSVPTRNLFWTRR